MSTAPAAETGVFARFLRTQVLGFFLLPCWPRRAALPPRPGALARVSPILGLVPELANAAAPRQGAARAVGGWGA